MCNGLFGDNSCAWVLILAIVFLICKCNNAADDDCGNVGGSGNCNCGCSCGCGCN